MLKIENEFLEVSFRVRGAELSSILGKKTGLQYLWQGSPEFWAKQSPILFPIVGTLKNDTFLYGGKEYQLTRHGFARERDFRVKSQGTTELEFSLRSDADTMAIYPFHFTLDILYVLDAESLKVTYTVTNEGGEPMFFSIGGHPAFALPLAGGTGYEEYSLVLNREEHAGRWPISAAGLIEEKPIPFLENSCRIPLHKSLFYQDAIVLKNLKSDSISLVSEKTPHGWRFDFPGFPFLGLWASRDADFVCVEPWCGIADSVDSDQQLTRKEGIQVLEIGEIFQRTWMASFY